jgi:hypothetical protein
MCCLASIQFHLQTASVTDSCNWQLWVMLLIMRLAQSMWACAALCNCQYGTVHQTVCNLMQSFLCWDMVYAVSVLALGSRSSSLHVQVDGSHLPHSATGWNCWPHSLTGRGLCHWSCALEHAAVTFARQQAQVCCCCCLLLQCMSLLSAKAVSLMYRSARQQQGRIAATKRQVTPQVQCCHNC